MRKPRVIVNGEACYHVMSRCALQTFLFEDESKRMFVKMMRRAECFSGVHIINYCVMDNHFHILVRVPKKMEISEDTLRARIEVLYGERSASIIFSRWKDWEEQGNAKAAEAEKAAFRKRMFDLPEFMKTLKQRYSLWYRMAHGGIEGTIWQGAFHSVVVDDTPAALSTVSAYIDLNPVRAGIVDDASQYEWNGFGAMKRGSMVAKGGLMSIFADKDPKLAIYQSILQQKAPQGEQCAVPDAEAVAGANLRKRNRLISRGIAFGSEHFVRQIIIASSGEKASRTVPQAIGSGQQTLYCSGRRQTTNQGLA